MSIHGDPFEMYGEIITAVIYTAGLIAFAWLVRSQFPEKEAPKPESKKVNLEGHDLFESTLDEIKLRRDSRTEMNFAKAANGTYKDPRTQQAYTQFQAAPSHERSSDNFLLSLMVGYATDSAILGYALGGSLLGGIVGAGMHHETKTKSDSDSDSGLKEKPSSFFGSSPSDSGDSCRASDYSYSGISSGSYSSSSYSSSDSSSSSSDTSSSSSSSSD